MNNIGYNKCTCGGTGKVKGAFGVMVECSCVKEMREVKKIKAEQEFNRPILSVGEAVKKKAISLGYIPEHRIEDDYSSEILLENIGKMCKQLFCGIKNDAFLEYTSTLDGILSNLRIGDLPKCSYLIGGSNGFGKTTFVNTAIKILMAQDKVVAPYKSLIEISDLMYKDYTRLINNRKKMYSHQYKSLVAGEYGEEDQEEESYLDQKASQFEWRDYLRADLVFCYLTGVDNDCMWLEMSTLKKLLQLRSENGKPTIVMMAESLDWYRNNKDVRKYILNEILEYDKEGHRYDKVKHISVSLIDGKSLEDTGRKGR